ncbi:MAG: hypothetical protein R3B13_04165 [Polyangiaceae bacterium]
MSASHLSRRAFGAVVGTSAAALGAGQVAQAPTPSSPVDLGAPGELLRPLAAGSRLGAWHVQEVLPLTDGAVSVLLRDEAGSEFQLDVCARDPGASAPGQSEHFAVFVVNRGDGAVPTHESHGLAAMALADVIRGNEAGVDRSGFLSVAARAQRGLARRHLP